ncbi:hypothetical protein [Sphingomonas abaci]|uniref:Colicin transporter n=1 Tax=Sphingomonas abaci TaxID=237611 RepID=A0A7W7AKL8_9SPHN|nr:hypothetical protein [Sphingomonas abaci]MBB4618773.1 hypothetical protein [Sphingomonas abaci]
MTAAYRLKGFAWFGVSVAVVLGFYLVSLQVANERKKLEQVNRRIATAERDIRALETEFDTRANLAQLERWNGDTLALSAPTAQQFVGDEAALAAIDVHAAPAPGGDGAPVRTAALLVPSGVPPQPAMTLVAANAPAPVAPAAAAPVRGTVRAATAGKGLDVGLVRTAAVAAATTAAAKVKPDAVALLDRKLLSERTLGDILSRARTEASGKR